MMDTTTVRAQAHELRLAQELPIAPADVFRMWRERLAEWWAPAPFTTQDCEVDLRPGGRLRAVMRSPDGTEFPCRGIFLEVVENRRIVFTDAFSAAWEPNPDAFFTADITLEPLAGGRTCYLARALHWTAEARAKHEAMGFHQGWSQCLDQMVAVALRQNNRGVA